MRYLVEIGIDLEKEEASFLIPLEIIQAPALGEILKDNFVRGWKTAG
jgi:DCN1-like protein 1/2